VASTVVPKEGGVVEERVREVNTVLMLQMQGTVASAVVSARALRG
jgi:hypothetical protein